MSETFSWVFRWHYDFASTAEKQWVYSNNELSYESLELDSNESRSELKPGALWN